MRILLWGAARDPWEFCGNLWTMGGNLWKSYRNSVEIVWKLCGNGNTWKLSEHMRTTFVNVWKLSGNLWTFVQICRNRKTCCGNLRTTENFQRIPTDPAHALKVRYATCHLIMEDVAEEPAAEEQRRREKNLHTSARVFFSL